jgi:hypothetical protein
MATDVRTALPLRQDVVVGIAGHEVLRLLLALERFRQGAYAPHHVTGQVPGRYLPPAHDVAFAVQPLDHGVGEEAVAEVGVLQRLLVEAGRGAGDNLA